MTYSNRGNDSFGGSNYDRPAMFDATCAKCGSACKVPFKPNGRKEVFCSKCFETNGGGSRESNFGSRESSFGSPRGPRMFDKRDSGGSNFSDRQMFGATCDQCGERCEVPFRPTNGKPVLCSNCFAGKNDRSPRSNENSYSRPVASNNFDFEAINSKLDRILKLLSPVTPKIMHDESTEEAKVIAKEITSKILEEIEMTSGKKVETGKKKVKVASKKKAE